MTLRPDQLPCRSKEGRKEPRKKMEEEEEMRKEAILSPARTTRRRDRYKHTGLSFTKLGRGEERCASTRLDLPLFVCSLLLIAHVA